MKFGYRNNLAEVVASFGKRMDESRAAIGRGIKRARPQTDTVLRSEAKQSFNIRDPRADRMWRVGASTKTLTLHITNMMRGFEMHVTGGTIGPRSGSALLIPLNTLGRIGTKKLYKLVDWLRREKLTVIRGGILYVRVPMNKSGRGGVAPGTRVHKGFRTKFQGTIRRPSGFDIKLNAEGLTPIAVVKRSISMRARFDVQRVTEARIIPVILDNVRAELLSQR